jgi:copper chaperone CopZ
MIKLTLHNGLKTTLAAIALALFLGTAFMASASEPASPTYHLEVGGLACPFCAYGVEKQLNAVQGVDKIDIDIKTSIITLTMKKGIALDEETARRAVKDAGFSLQNFKKVQPSKRIQNEKASR